jgi:hypothetical protein
VKIMPDRPDLSMVTERMHCERCGWGYAEVRVTESGRTLSVWRGSCDCVSGFGYCPMPDPGRNDRTTATAPATPTATTATGIPT